MLLSKFFKLFLVLGYFSTLNSSTDTKTGGRQNARRLLLFNYFSLSYISHASSSAVTKLPNKTSTFHDFQETTIKSHDFPGLENEMLKFLDFPGFYDLYEPCYQQKQNIPPFSLSARSVHGLLKTLQIQIFFEGKKH